MIGESEGTNTLTNKNDALLDDSGGVYIWVFYRTRITLSL